MTAARREGPAPDDPPTGARTLPLLGLTVLPVMVGVGFALLPLVRVSDAVADAGAAAWTSTAVIAALALAARAKPSLRTAVLMGLAASTALIVVAVRGGASIASVVVVGLALAALAQAVGGAIGRRIAHPGHLAPACAVAGGADLMSVLSPEGPSKAIAASEAAVSVLVVAGPVPGHAGAIAPTIGLGDLVFIALLFGASAAHGVPRWRVTIAAATGVTVALLVAAMLHAAVPALPAIGLAAVLVVPAFRDVRPRDRGAARAGIAIGLALGAFAVVRAVLASPLP